MSKEELNRYCENFEEVRKIQRAEVSRLIPTEKLQQHARLCEFARYFANTDPARQDWTIADRWVRLEKGMLGR